jgi:membrane protein YdbS with pleckstrin-like domain
VSRPLRLRPPRHRVARRAITWWTARTLLLAVPAAALPAAAGLPAVAAALPSAAGPVLDPARVWLWAAAGVLGGVGLLIAAVVPVWRYRVHRWEVTEAAVYTSSGWLWQEWRVAPMSRIQTVDTGRGPLQRLFGLSSVTVTTASAAGPLSIDGLDHRRATALADRLTASTEAAKGDAT